MTTIYLLQPVHTHTNTKNMRGLVHLWSKEIGKTDLKINVRVGEPLGFKVKSNAGSKNLCWGSIIECIYNKNRVI